MASRILFEDDIKKQGVDNANQHESNKDITVKYEDPANADICSPNEKQEFTKTDSSITNITEKTKRKDSVLFENVIILGSKVNDEKDEEEGNISQYDGNTSEDEGNTSQGEDNNSQHEGNTSQDKGNTSLGEGNTTHEEGKSSQGEDTEDNKNLDAEVKTKAKRKNKTVLDMLLLDVKKHEEEDLDTKYDVFGDDNNIFKKYKLRKSRQIISYKEPADIKPKRYSTDTELDLTCPVCKQEFEKKSGLVNHLRIHNKTVIKYTCSLCNEKFDRNAGLMAHRKKHTGESFLCQDCKLAFSNYCDYLVHNYEHLNQPHFKCSECGLRFRKAFYKQHVKTHFENKLSCDLCSFATNNESRLRAHSNLHNSNKFICVECGKVCKVKAYFDYHMSMHTGVKKFQCLYCGKGFRNRNAKDIHTRTHTGEKPFTCEICGHKARQWTDYKRHKETHNTDQKYICDLCGKKYLHKDYLVVHMRTHTKKNLYECPECNARFVTVVGLKTHTMFKHTSERPVECALCNKKFINHNQYMKHCRAKYHMRNVYANGVKK